jgi:hypothetical protein
MSHIETALHQVHATRKGTTIKEPPTTTTTKRNEAVASAVLTTLPPSTISETTPNSLLGKPFARVNAVSPDSPAWDAVIILA